MRYDIMRPFQKSSSESADPSSQNEDEPWAVECFHHGTGLDHSPRHSETQREATALRSNAAPFQRSHVSDSENANPSTSYGFGYEFSQSKAGQDTTGVLSQLGPDAICSSCQVEDHPGYRKHYEFNPWSENMAASPPDRPSIQGLQPDGPLTLYSESGEAKSLPSTLLSPMSHTKPPLSRYEADFNAPCWDIRYVTPHHPNETHGREIESVSPSRAQSVPQLQRDEYEYAVDTTMGCPSSWSPALPVAVDPSRSPQNQNAEPELLAAPILPSPNGSSDSMTLEGCDEMASIPFQLDFFDEHPPASNPPTTDPVESCGKHDVLCGRGTTAAWSYPGNHFYRLLIRTNRERYILARKRDKPQIAQHILETIRARGGRFLRETRPEPDRQSRVWEELPDEKAYEKICQALREGAAEKRRQMRSASSGGNR